MVVIHSAEWFYMLCVRGYYLRDWRLKVSGNLVVQALGWCHECFGFDPRSHFSCDLKQKKLHLGFLLRLQCSVYSSHVCKKTKKQTKNWLSYWDHMPEWSDHIFLFLLFVLHCIASQPFNWIDTTSREMIKKQNWQFKGSHSSNICLIITTCD